MVIRLSEGMVIRKKSKLFLERGISSLLISIELFNRPYERGRIEGVLLMLHHAFEMLLKATIYQKTGKIRENGSNYNYTFRTCVYKLKDPLHIIDENKLITLNTIDDLRDCAMHDIISLSEDTLYFHTQSGVTLFDDLLRSQFNKHLKDDLPDRILPISTHPPASITSLFDEEFTYIQKLISPRKRSMVEAISKLRPIVVLEKNITNTEASTADNAISKIINELKNGKPWKDLFPGVANLRMDSTGSGLTYSLRLTKGEGLPVRPLRAGEDPNEALAYREVDLLERYPFDTKKLIEKSGLNRRETLAIVEHLNIKSVPEFYKLITVGKIKINRYSQRALEYINEKKEEIDLKAVCKEYQIRHY